MQYFQKAESVKISNMTCSTGRQGQGLSMTFIDFQGLSRTFREITKTLQHYNTIAPEHWSIREIEH